MFVPKVIENIQEFQCHEKHNKPVFAIRLDQNISNEKRLYCKECSNLNDIKFIPLTKVVQLSTDSIEKTLQKFKNLFDPLYELLLKFQQSISQLKSLLFSILNELETITSDWISCIQATGQQMSRYNLFDELDKLINNQKQTEYQNDEKIMKEYKNLYIKHLTKVNSTLKQFKGFTSKIVDCFKIIKEISNKNQECQLQPLSDQNILQKSPYQSSENSLSNATSLELSQKVTQRTFQYQFELLNQSYKEQNECNAFAINHNNTILLAALNNAPLFSIKIMQMSYWQEIQQLNQKESLTLKVIQILEGNHENFVTTLNFFSSTPMRDSFISGSSDTTIIIWSTFTKQNPKQLFWNPLIKLFGHQSIVLCLVLHHEENLFISGSSDYSIKFWSSSNQQQWSCQQTIEEHTDQVYGLSLNDAGNQVISCGNDKQILVIEGINNKEWHVKQKIQIQQIGFRLSFITSKLFAFQPSSQAFLQFYELNSIGVFVKTKILQINGVDQCCDCFFPSVYIPLKGVMLSKNGQNLNIIQFSFGSQDWDCKLQQAIEFETQKFLQGRTYGTISPNGNFIVTWDVKSKEIQIRQYRTMI